MLKIYQQIDDEHAKAKNHYQDLRALCAYLSFRYPEKYFLFKFKMYSKFKKLVNYVETSKEEDSEIRKYVKKQLNDMSDWNVYNNAVSGIGYDLQETYNS